MLSAVEVMLSLQDNTRKYQADFEESYWTVEARDDELHRVFFFASLHASDSHHTECVWIEEPWIQTVVVIECFGLERRLDEDSWRMFWLKL